MAGAALVYGAWVTFAKYISCLIIRERQFQVIFWLVRIEQCKAESNSNSTAELGADLTCATYDDNLNTQF